MHIACNNEWVEIVKILVFHKAELNSVDGFKKVPGQYLMDRIEYYEKVSGVENSAEKLKELQMLWEFLKAKGAKLTWKYRY